MEISSRNQGIFALVFSVSVAAAATAIAVSRSKIESRASLKPPPPASERPIYYRHSFNKVSYIPGTYQLGEIKVQEDARVLIRASLYESFTGVRESQFQNVPWNAYFLGRTHGGTEENPLLIFAEN